MLRKKQKVAALPGSAEFGFWGACAVGSWGEHTAGGDRTHTSFVDNPQFVLRAPAGTNFCVVLHDCEEDARQKEKIKSRPLFLRLCVTAATPEALESRLKVLEMRLQPCPPLPSPCDPTHNHTRYPITLLGTPAPQPQPPRCSALTPSPTLSLARALARAGARHQP